MSTDGSCTIVTGSASGLGAATAAILAKGGARIVVNYSNSKKEAEETADLCRKAGGDVVVVQGDVSRDEDCKDRKSTRLNSSHSQISYAVFCLKKKKQK